MGVTSGRGYPDVGVASGWKLWVWLESIVESGWNLWVWLVGVVSRRQVWLVGGIYGCCSGCCKG